MLLRNLRQGVRLAFLRPVDARAWSVSAEQLIALASLALIAGIAVQRTFYGTSAAFNWYTLREQWIDVPVFLLVGWLAVRFSTRPLKLLTVPIALFAAIICINVLLGVALHVGRLAPSHSAYLVWVGIYYLGYAWLFALAVVLLRRTARLAYRYIPIALVPLVVLSAYEFFYPSGSIWYEPRAEASAQLAAGPSLVDEEVFHLQAELAREVNAALAPQRPGVADLYFVGFAPYAREDVFMKETEVIGALMDERFDTRGRSVLFINNNSTLRKYPIATVTNLRAALQRIGDRIDPEEDVVMIYLTSHGGKDHRLSASHWPLALEEVDPLLLKQLLDEAGIGWRVVVVSACYSGGFIEPLRGPKTLVMTAADATHTSFGCGTGSEFTYFAKALFDEQLRATRSLEEAFARAIPVIRERERQLGEEFSNPQIAIGEAMRAKLADIERRLDGAE